MKTHFTQEWKDWLTLNINNGQNKDGLFKILLDEGYDFNAIVKEMNYLPSVPVSQLVNPFDAGKKAQIAEQAHNVVLQHHHQKSVITSKNNFGIATHGKTLDIDNAEKLACPQLEIYTLDKFLNTDECDKVISLIKSKLRKSELSTVQTDDNFRTSRTCDLGILNDDFMANIDNKICQTIGIDASYSEVVQGQYYQVGQQFKAHTDYFEANEIGKYGGAMGQRSYTMMIYLNNVESGGETEFTRINKSFSPKQGMAVIWNNLLPDGRPNIDSMHFAKPILKGYKAVITKWFRSKSNTSPAPNMWLR